MDITLTDVLEFVGTYAFAISGIRLAAGKKFDWFGAFIIGLITAVGGGTIRDMMLGITPFWMENSIYFIETFVAFITVLLFSKYLVSQHSTLEKTLSLGFPLWVAIIMGTITGSAGGVLRDVFINEVPLIFRKEIYAMACVFGGLIYGVCMWIGLGEQITSLISGAGVFLLRYFADAKHISLPTLSDPLAHEKETTNSDSPSGNNPSAS